MRWNRGQNSSYVRDLRGQRRGGFGSGGFGLPTGRGRAGMGGIGAIVGLVLMLVLGGGGVLGGAFGGSSGGAGYDVGPDLGPFPAAPRATGNDFDAAPDPDAETVDFMKFVMDDVQQTWSQQFQRAGRRYEPTYLNIFEEVVDTGCGRATSATGPFYCPADRQAYLDLGFFRELRSRFGAPGDFAQAYVVAHEVGHHVQNVLGVNEDVRRLQQQNPEDANDLSVRLELQADCFAGIWGYSTFERGVLEEGDVQEGLDAAAAVGDDRIQREATGRIDPETWTHGSSRQRMDWFNRGYESGDPEACDTFSADI